MTCGFGCKNVFLRIILFVCDICGVRYNCVEKCFVLLIESFM